jgi:hypothetical protein
MFNLVSRFISSNNNRQREPTTSAVIRIGGERKSAHSKSRAPSSGERRERE